MAVTDNAAERRFEMEVEGSVAFVAYRRDGDRIVLTHTEVPPALSGKGVGSRLAHDVLEEVRGRGLRVVPRCEFIAAYLQRHPEYQDLVASGSGEASP
jgi:predicted GNAT family acetyltransferase